MARPTWLIIVRNPEMFAVVQNSADRWPPGTGLLLDRRASERRVRRLSVASDRRRRERRAKPDAAWEARGFLVVAITELPPQALPLGPLAGSPDHRDDTGR
jgi:hypothetical protein